MKRLRKYRSYFEPDEDFAVPYTTKVRWEDRAGSTVNFDSDSTNSTFELEEVSLRPRPRLHTQVVNVTRYPYLG